MINRRWAKWLLWFSLGLLCCASPGPVAAASTVSPPKTADGVRRITVFTAQGTFSVWTKRVGENPTIKVLLLHGGPGGTHEYFEGLEPSLLKSGVEFFYFDQLGSGHSDRPADEVMSKLLSVERSVEEVEQVRRGLGLDESNFFLLGHSWGGIVALEYALKHGHNLKGLVVSNMMASIPAYNAYAHQVLMPQMDPKVLEELLAFEAKKDFDNPRYDALLEGFYSAHVLRSPRAEWPEPVKRSFSHFNTFVYRTMQGPSEMGLSGRLEQWDVSARLSEIEVPTLVIAAAHDTMDPTAMAQMAKAVKKGRLLLCPKGSHFAMYDDAEVYAAGLIQFLHDVDAAAKQ
jgi:proline iminopeptidase